MNKKLIEKIPILFDCDGVCINFDRKVINYINQRDGTNIDWRTIKNQPTECSFFDSEDSLKFVCSDTFCTDLEILPIGFNAAIKLMNDGYNVQFVTSPYYWSKTWTYQRTRWLEKNFGVSREKIHFCSDKRYMHGISLVEDNVTKLNNWYEYWLQFNFDYPLRPILIEHEYNKDKYLHPDIPRVKTCDEILSIITSGEKK